jgi:hypothetical protein
MTLLALSTLFLFPHFDLNNDQLDEARALSGKTVIVTFIADESFVAWEYPTIFLTGSGSDLIKIQRIVRLKDDHPEIKGKQVVAIGRLEMTESRQGIVRRQTESATFRIDVKDAVLISAKPFEVKK